MADSPISLLKKFFLVFFSKMAEPQFTKGYESMDRFGGSKGRRAYEVARKAWIEYKKNSKSLILSYSSTVTSLVDVIGQPGVDAFNNWLGTYAAGDGEISSDGVKGLRAWYDQYLKPLS